MEGFGDKLFVEGVKRHERVLEHEVAEVHEALVLILDVEEYYGGDVAHSLDVTYIWPVHGEGPQDLNHAVVVFHVLLEERKVAESPLDILINQRDGLLTGQHRVGRAVDLNEH